MWVSSVSPSPTLQSSWEKNVFKMLIFLFLRLLYCQSKAAVAILQMYMYNNLLILKLPWLSRHHARATCTVSLKIFTFPRILAVLAITSNMHCGALTTFTRSFRPPHSCWKMHLNERERNFNFSVGRLEWKKFEMVVKLDGNTVSWRFSDIMWMSTVVMISI